MAEKLFPERQRCKGCGKGLGAAGAPVWLGLFCAAKCAKMAEPITDPNKAPRECKTERGGKWEFKRRYRSESELPGKLRDDPLTSIYSCPNCGHYHLGHSRINLANETSSVLGDRAVLAGFLVKSRGKATHKQVAEVAGIRPIRLKELEDPEFISPDLPALFKVLAAYRVKLAVVMRADVGR